MILQQRADRYEARLRSDENGEFEAVYFFQWRASHFVLLDKYGLNARQTPAPIPLFICLTIVRPFFMAITPLSK